MFWAHSSTCQQTLSPHLIEFIFFLMNSIDEREKKNDSIALHSCGWMIFSTTAAAAVELLALNRRKSRLHFFANCDSHLPIHISFFPFTFNFANFFFIAAHYCLSFVLHEIERQFLCESVQCRLLCGASSQNSTDTATHLLRQRRRCVFFVCAVIIIIIVLYLRKMYFI